MTETYRDLAYATQSPTQKLDVYLPDRVNGSCPVIVYLHPGGFTMGDKDMIQPLLSGILTRGYAAVSVDYRLATESRFPAQVWDAKAAVRWVRANAAQYHFDPHQVVAWGISAGSTLAALLGTTAGIQELEDRSMGNPAFSSAVDAVVSLYGPMNFSTLNAQRIELGQKPADDSESSGESEMLGGPISRIPEKYRLASAQTYINARCPPFYIQHGTSDDIIPYLQSVRFAGALETLIGKANVKLSLIANAGHFDRIQSSSENIALALDFLEAHLK
jgi:acetyl esterase/lipase